MYSEYVTEVLEHVLNRKIILLIAQHVPGTVKYLIWHRCLLSVVTELELKVRRTGHFARPNAQARTRTGIFFFLFS